MGQGKRSDATNFEENKRDPFRTYNDDAGIYELKRGMIHDQSLTSRKGGKGTVPTVSLV